MRGIGMPRVAECAKPRKITVVQASDPRRAKQVRLEPNGTLEQLLESATAALSSAKVAGGETVILLHPTPPLVGVPIGTEREVPAEIAE